VLTVNTRINQVANDDEECSPPVELAQNSESSLFVARLKATQSVHVYFAKEHQAYHWA
jgi:hypothetical protein